MSADVMKRKVPQPATEKGRTPWEKLFEVDSNTVTFVFLMSQGLEAKTTEIPS